MEITKKDVYWNYGATFLRIASSALLLPFILKMLPSEKVGIWAIFMTITAFAGLLDFGFSSSFTRNVTYVFSGVKTFRKTGFETVDKEGLSIDYGLLKGLIASMRWFYSRVAIILFILLITLGTYYIYFLLQNYKGESQEVYISWGILCVISTYNIFTLYYDSLLKGKGLIKRSLQIVVVGNAIYLILASLLILKGFGLIAIVSAQASSVIIVRWLSYRSFFTNEIKQKINTSISVEKKEILKAITTNSVKIGLTSLGAFMVLRSTIIIGSLNIPLNDIASFSITMQLIGVISGLAGIYAATYQPKIVNFRVIHNKKGIKEIYIKSQFVLIFSYIIGGAFLLIFGKWGINLIGSKTQLLPNLMILTLIIISFLEVNHSLAGGILLSKNEVPFFKASLFAGVVTIILLLFLFQYTDIGIWAMILAPGIAQGLYQNWKWPLVVFNELEITLKDVFKSFRSIYINKINK